MLRKDVFFTILTRYYLLFIGVISGIIIARVLGPEGRGQYGLIITTFMIMASIGDLGLSMAGAYFVGQKKASVREIASTAVSVGLSIGVVLMVCSFCFFRVVRVWELPISSGYFQLVIGVLPFFLVGTYLRTIFQGMDKLKQFNLLTVFAPTIQLLSILLLVGVFHLGLDGAILAFTLGTLFSFIMTTMLLLRTTTFSFTINFPLLRKLVKYGLKVYLASMSQTLAYRLDYFFVGYLLDVEHIGYYAVGTAVAELMWKLPTALGIVAFSKRATATVSSNELTCRLCRTGLLIVALGAAVLFFSGKFLISIFYGGAYLPAVVPLMWLLPGIVMFTIHQILHSDLAAQGRPEVALYASVASLTVMVTLDFILIPVWGLKGAAIASSIAYSLGACIVLYKFLQITGASVRSVLVTRPSDWGFLRGGKSWHLE